MAIGLRDEAVRTRQPFGRCAATPQSELSPGRRAIQLQHVHLAQLYARMGYTEAAVEAGHIVRVASARMLSDDLLPPHLRARRPRSRRLDAGRGARTEVETLLHRAIECGALVDPWNIVGFAAQFSLLPRDGEHVPRPPRRRTDRTDGATSSTSHARLERRGRRRRQYARCKPRFSAALDPLSQWWDQFATHRSQPTSTGSPAANAWESADQVATALAAWHQAGTAAGDVAFWRRARRRVPFAEGLRAWSSRRCSTSGDLVAAMALLIHWLEPVGRDPAGRGQLLLPPLAPAVDGEAVVGDRSRRTKPPPRDARAAADRWSSTRKFLDYLEANAEAFWEVPRLELSGQTCADEDGPRDVDDEAGRGRRTGSSAPPTTTSPTATRPTTASRATSSKPSDTATDSELAYEADRISQRLAFLRDSRPAVESGRHRVDGRQRPRAARRCSEAG